MTTEPCCPSCGDSVALLDMLDICPPIPYSHWPARWSVDNGEGGNLLYCLACDADFDEDTVADIAEASGRERGYPLSPETAARAAQAAYEEAHATYADTREDATADIGYHEGDSPAGWRS